MRQADKLRQVGLGVQLRKLREGKGLSTRSVARSIGISPSSVNRNELGLRAPNREEVSALCALYGVTGQEKQELVGRVGETEETAAWLATGYVPDQLASLMVLEREAVSIVNVQTSVMPGYTQTADYARLVLGNPEGHELERRVATRLGRQAILSRPRAPQVDMLIDEAVLYRTLGNRRVLREQLEHLVTVQRRENVSLRVIPLDVGAIPPNDGSFEIYRLADGTPYVFLEARSLAVFVTDPVEVKPFVEMCASLADHALDEQASSDLIKKVSESLADG